MPFNFHINVEFRPHALAHPIGVELQIWFSDISDFNETSHWFYEIERAASPGSV